VQAACCTAATLGARTIVLSTNPAIAATPRKPYGSQSSGPRPGRGSAALVIGQLLPCLRLDHPCRLLPPTYLQAFEPSPVPLGRKLRGVEP
jgi:hypothetical protein